MLCRPLAPTLFILGAVAILTQAGFEKREQMSYVFTTEDLAAMAGVRAALNPRDLFNPDKVLPRGIPPVEKPEVALSAGR